MLTSALPNFRSEFLLEKHCQVKLFTAVVSGGAGGADYAHHITASTPGFENLMTSLSILCANKAYLTLHRYKKVLIEAGTDRNFVVEFDT